MDLRLLKQGQERGKSTQKFSDGRTAGKETEVALNLLRSLIVEKPLLFDISFYSKFRAIIPQLHKKELKSCGTDLWDKTFHIFKLEEINKVLIIRTI